MFTLPFLLVNLVIQQWKVLWNCSYNDVPTSTSSAASIPVLLLSKIA
jgi:hypothetical protein